MRGLKHFPERKKNLLVDFLGDYFCLLDIYTQMLGQARDKIFWVRKAQYNVSTLFGKKSCLLYREDELFAHLKNTFGILNTHHLIFQ